jgi:hypothetical protein
VKEVLAEIEDSTIIELKPGAAALGVLRFNDALYEKEAGSSSPFLTSRPLSAVGSEALDAPGQDQQVYKPPSHILYRNIAYPITKKPLFIGIESAEDGYGIQIHGQIAGVSRKHCMVQLIEENVVLNDFSTYGTFVDENPVSGKINLSIGQTVRIGTPGEILLLIKCLDKETDET